MQLAVRLIDCADINTHCAGTLVHNACVAAAAELHNLCSSTASHCGREDLLLSALL